MTPDRVALMRHVRRLLRQGKGVKAISAETGCQWGEVRVQRHLMQIASGEPVAARGDGIGFGRRTRVNKAAAETSGDLCDILAAPASRRDLRFWGEA